MAEIKSHMMTVIGESRTLLHSRYTLSKDEGRVLVMAMERMRREGAVNTNGEYIFTVADYCALFDISRDEAVKDIKHALETLYERSVHVRDGDDEVTMRWISAKYKNVQQGKYGVTFTPAILHYIEIHANELTIPLKMLADMSNENNRKMIRWINEAVNEGKKSLTLDLDVIRYELDLQDKPAYEIYNNLKRRVLLPAIDNINSVSDMGVVMVENKNGKKVISVTVNWESSQILQIARPDRG